MSDQVHIVPVKGKLVLDMQGRRVPEEGMRVTMNTFWGRCLKDGGITIREDQPKRKTTKKAVAKKDDE